MRAVAIIESGSADAALRLLTVAGAAQVDAGAQCMAARR